MFLSLFVQYLMVMGTMGVSITNAMHFLVGHTCYWLSVDVILILTPTFLSYDRNV